MTEYRVSRDKMETTISFGYWIRRQRKALDLTQQALAERVGCSLAAIKKIEGDERRPSRQIAERLADVLRVPADQREMFLEVARGLRPVDQLPLAREPTTSVPSETPKPFPHNLPMQLTSFIGRERELDEVTHLLSNTRLLTLTGPGGTGKTRLALHLGAEMLALKQFANGVWLVELAPLADPTLVAPTIAATLGVREQPRRSILDALTDYVRAKSMLLILDNCEHLIQACAQITESLLHAAPRLKVVVTSREALGITGETAYRVPSLPLPDPRQLRDLDVLEQNECVHLFIDRAMAAHPSFRLKENNASAVASICQRLDGIPLAIELAAARTKVFPPEEIATRLDDRFRLLTGGSRTALERHQTLFALIEWSHNLLSEQERVLLRRLSVFTGGWSFDAVQSVCGEGLGNDVLDLLTHLVDKSLVAVEEETEEARYRLPETIRQYARDKLYESGEAKQVRDRHLEFFIRFAETAEPKLRSAEQLEWLERLGTEHDNLRTALGWSLESSKTDRALELAGALSYFWELRGYFSEGQKWFDNALALDERDRSEKLAAGKYASTHEEMARRAKALYGNGMFRFAMLSDPFTAHRMVEECCGLFRELGDKWWMAVALARVGLMLHFEGDLQTSRARLEEGVSLAREMEDPWPLAVCLIRLGDNLKGTDAAAARQILEEGVAVARSAGDRSVLSEGLHELGGLYAFEGDLTAAVSLEEEALAEARAMGSLVHKFLALFQLVTISCLQNDLVKAKGYCSEAWALGRDTGSPFAAVFALWGFGFVAIFSGHPGRGVRLLTAFEEFTRQHGVNFGVEGEPTFMVYKQALEKARLQLDPVAFEAALQEGRTLTPEQAIALATEGESEEVLPPKA
jgi:predicted ATPase/transcriptional regulator with XRE-family HTH domain